MSIKLKWKVAPEPTGRYRSFETRSWPTAYYEDGTTAGFVISTTKESYIPRLVREGKHAPLELWIVGHSSGLPSRRLKARFATLEEAKAALPEALAANPQYLPIKKESGT